MIARLRNNRDVLLRKLEANGPGEFYTPHGIDLDATGNIYVADRDNNRIEKFDANGTFLKEWKNNEAVQLYSLSIDKKNDQLFAIDYLTIAKTIIKGSDILQLIQPCICPFAWKIRFVRWPQMPLS